MHADMQRVAALPENTKANVESHGSIVKNIIIIIRAFYKLYSYVLR